MIRFLADENLNGYIVAGLRRRQPQVELITATEADLKGVADPDLLDFAARENRAVLTHDVTTMIDFANAPAPQPRDAGHYRDQRSSANFVSARQSKICC